MNRKHIFITILLIFTIGVNTLIITDLLGDHNRSNHLPPIKTATLKSVIFHGMVKNEFGYELTDCDVTIIPNDLGTPFLTKTDGNGNYSLIISTEVPQDFTIEVFRSGYDAFRVTVFIPDPSESEYEFTEDDGPLIEETTYPNEILVRIDALLNKTSGDEFVIEGCVKDYNNGQKLIGASIKLYSETITIIDDYLNPDVVKTLILESSTNSYGFFHLSTNMLNPGDIEITNTVVKYYIKAEKSGYTEYETAIILNINRYKYIEMKLIDLSFVTLYGQVKGLDDDNSMKDLEGALIEVILQSTGETLINGTTNKHGSYFIPVEPYPDESFLVRVSMVYYTQEEFIISATPGLYRKDITLEREPYSEEGIFDAFFSKIKEAAVDFLKETFLGGGEIGSSKNYKAKFDFEVVSFGIDIDLVYSAPCEVTIDVVSGPEGNRQGTFFAFAFIPEAPFLKAVFRVGGTIRVIDPDGDIFTNNRIFIVESLEGGGAIRIAFDKGLADLIMDNLLSDEFTSAFGKDKVESTKRNINNLLELKNLVNNIYILPGIKLDIEGDLNFALAAEAGLKLMVNGKNSSLIANDGEGWQLESISAYLYTLYQAKLELSLGVTIEFYVPFLFRFKLASGSFNFKFNFEAGYNLINLTYFFDDNELLVNLLRGFVHIDCEASVDWSALGGLIQGHKDLIQWDGIDLNSGYLYSFSVTFGDGEYTTFNYQPLKPSVSGPSETCINTPKCYSFTGEDPDWDDIKYFIDWGDGTYSNSEYMKTGTAYTLFKEWSIEGQYTIEVKTYDGEFYSNIRKFIVDVYGVPEPNIDGPESVGIGKSATFIASVDTPISCQVRYKLTLFKTEEYDGQQYINPDPISEWTSNWLNSDVTVSKTYTFYEQTLYFLEVRVETSYGAMKNNLKTIEVINSAPLKPNTPTGMDNGWTVYEYEFTFWTVDPENHDIQYFVDWGDGTYFTSNWLTSGNALICSHKWADGTESGTYYNIKVKVKDEYGLWSDWSNSKSILIKAPIPSTPEISGTLSPNIGQNYPYTATSSDPLSQNIRYIFDWGDGTSYTSSWVQSGTLVSGYHIYNTPGIKTLTITVENIHGYCKSKSIQINVINSAPNKPNTPTGPSEGEVENYYTFSFRTTDPEGHNIRYQVDWGDGSTWTSGWVSSGTTVSKTHKWTVGAADCGIPYSVKVRAQDIYGAWSSWSNCKVICISEADDGGGIIITPFMTDISSEDKKVTDSKILDIFSFNFIQLLFMSILLLGLVLNTINYNKRTYLI
ncbi:MAG: hypothetical protein ACFE9Z_15200 [Promethearchaeota archaeon]